MNRLAAAAGIALLGGIAAWTGVSAYQDTNSQAPALPLGNDAAPAGADDDAPVVKSKPAAVAPADQLSHAETPMADRVAVIGVLNKRNGVSRDLTLKPGQAVRVGDIVIRLRACETAAPWEAEPLTGAFLQVDTLGRDQRWRRIFSGWTYKESPSLNVVEHPIYDVWPKSCAMKFPDIGPDTEMASAVSGSGVARSSAKKSPDATTDGNSAAPPVPAATPAPAAPPSVKAPLSKAPPAKALSAKAPSAKASSSSTR